MRSVVWVLVVLAAARPQHVGEPIALPMTGRDLLMAVDLSGSMEERDFQLNGEWVDSIRSGAYTEYYEAQYASRLTAEA